jgi:glycosyltransferase involved in cell wall biosynthesis/peptidoglycan/xylan/chitin deacetylase (PgdA/CDA1 family)
MEIVFLTDQLVRGGAETQMVRLAVTLKQRGWQVGVISLLPSTGFADELRCADIPLFTCTQDMPAFRALPIRMTLAMYRQLLRWGPAMLVTFNYHSDIMGRVVGRLAGVQCILGTLRTAYVKTRFRKVCYRHTERLIDLTVSNSHAAVRFMVDQKVLRPGKTVVIPNGINVDAFTAATPDAADRALLPVPAGAFTWLAVGNLRPAKDYPTLLAAARICADADRNFRLFIVGEGPGRAALEQDLRRLGLEGQVTLLGSRSDVPRLLRACDAFVLSSAWEGMPNTVMEAMAAGLPVVSTDAGGVKELLVQGESGWIVPCGDAAGLAGRMLQVMQAGPEAGRAMGRAGRDRIQRQFAHEEIADRWEVLIQQFLRSRGPGAPAPAAGAAPDPPRPAPAPPALVVSLDLDLMWGARAHGMGPERAQAEREVVPALLELFRRYGIRATWAVPGAALYGRRTELLANLPEQRPDPADPAGAPYRELDRLGPDEAADPLHFGHSLARRILDQEGMELAVHTFLHPRGTDLARPGFPFPADLEACQEAFRRLALEPSSIIFPGNHFRYEYLVACAERGLRVFRGDQDAWMHKGTPAGAGSPGSRLVRWLDDHLGLAGDHGFFPRPFLDSGMVNCPSSRFLQPPAGGLGGLRGRRIAQAMEAAARRGRCFHLWLHPHQFGRDPGAGLAFLEGLLQAHVALRERFGLVSMTMGELGRSILPAEAD